jgi:hypothetical protein
MLQPTVYIPSRVTRVLAILWSSPVPQPSPCRALSRPTPVN